MPAIRASIRRHTTGLLIALATMTGPGHGMPAAPATPGTLRVLTLNVAHGRGDALNQLLVSQKAIEGNLAATAALLDGAKAEVVALQEADGPSRWSGGFDHVASLALLAGYPWHARSSHATSWLFDYGTALLSRAPVTEQRSLAFRPTPPSMTKGLTLAQISWRPDDRAEPIPLDVISVHLDFSRDSVRQRQAAEMVAFLSQRRHPVIVLGDFNSDWFAQASVVAELARRCGMKTYRPSAPDLGTYPSSGRRLDWVLISDELEFTHYAVLPQLVSDHNAVVADIRLKNARQDAGAGTAGAGRCSG